MHTLKGISRDILTLLSDSDKQPTDRELRHIAVSCSLELIQTAIEKGDGKIQLNEEMERLNDYVLKIESLLKNVN